MNKSLFLLSPFFLAFQASAVELTPITVPSNEGASLSRLSTQPTNAQSEHTLISWVEEKDNTATLYFSRFQANRWSSPTIVSSGTNWFNNWADFPSVMSQGKTMVAHWLPMTNQGTYDYRIDVAESSDNGKTWSKPFTPHTDGVDAEHGFVTMLPYKNNTSDGNSNSTFITWLDGRFTKTDVHNSHNDHEQNSHDHSSGGAMTLRAATFKNGQLNQEWELDNRVCDCCTTAAANTDKGVIVAYRDRTEDEIRDINVLRLIDGQWLPASQLPSDNWKIAGCPVNGPALDAKGNLVSLAWFTTVDKKPTVKVALSHDSGDHFSDAIIVSQKTIGRVDSVIHNDHVIVSYLENNGSKVNLVLSRYSLKGKFVDSNVITTLSPKRSTGFPTLTVDNGVLLVAWNDTRVHTVAVRY
ncbi:exo-alpha-sialidase [Vibrio sp.]|nr:exo-alpha-sialidase [Vibrio sp.]